MNFITPSLSDKRIVYAADYLEDKGYKRVNKTDNADFVLLGVNPDIDLLEYHIPVFAGNVSKDGVSDYTKDEAFAIKNAYLTAEAAVALAIQKSGFSLINSSVLITGYGRIGKALHHYLSVFTNDITVCARKDSARSLAVQTGAKAYNFDILNERNNYSLIFNTVPHPVFNDKELSLINKDTLIIDLASFPGGVDVHFAKNQGLGLIVARGLPSLYSPISAGYVVGETADRLIKEGKA